MKDKFFPIDLLVGFCPVIRENMSIVKGGKGETYLNLRVKTKSRKFMVEYYSDAIDVFVKSSPRRGKANREILQEFASILDISPNSLEIVKGHTSSTKILKIAGLSYEEIRESIIKYQPTRKMQ